MARSTDDAAYVSELITESEARLFEFATSGDWFLKHGWDRYGEAWQANIPRAPNGQPLINIVAQYLFNWQFQDFQVPLYYCPIPDRMVIGARGCGKTTTIAIANALRTIFHPGHNWLHVAPSLEQARAMFDIIIGMGGQGEFNRLFVRHTRAAPAPDIFLRPWDEYDIDPQFNFRSIGGHGGQPMELLRSLEAGNISADEAFRTFKSDYYVPILVGMSRGPNHYILNANPHLKREYQQRIHDIQVTADPLLRLDMQKALDKWVDVHNVAKERSLTLSGNAGIWPVWWSRYRWGKRHPDKRWSERWISEQNLYFTEDQRRFLEQQFEGDAEGLRVEMYAERPLISGGVFSATHIDNLSDESIDVQAQVAAEQGLPGWTYLKHEEHGLLSFREPAQANMAYAAGTDPGTGKIPRRNSWVIFVAELAGPPFKIVALECGNLGWRGQGTLDPWITAMKTIMTLYKFPRGHIASEATGPQKGVHQVVYGEDVEVMPLNMSSIKPSLIMQAQLMLSRDMFTGPNIDLLATQLIAYEHNDRKLDQDFVMAFLALVFVLWPYVEDEFETEPEKDADDWDWRGTTELHREVRDYSREVRDGR